MLQTLWITPEQKEEYRKITDLLPTIFPPEELVPPSVTDDILPYLCFYDDGRFIGFAQVSKRPDLHYLRYMAMLPEYRSQGYGGKMLDLILAERGNAPLALDVEPPDPRAANSEQRLRRIRFYLKHGLVDSGYLFEFGGTPFLLMSTGEKEVPGIIRKYCAADRRYAPGFIRIRKKETSKIIPEK